MKALATLAIAFALSACNSAPLTEGDRITFNGDHGIVGAMHPVGKAEDVIMILIDGQTSVWFVHAADLQRE